jgi:thioredoxin 2
MTPSTEIVACPACGAKNRVSLDRIAQHLAAVCGQCGAALADLGAPFSASDGTFDARVLQSPLPVLVDLWAPWCGPCRTIAPTIEAIARQNAGRLRVVKVNVDENPATAERFGVQGIPTLLVFKAGREIDRIVGALPPSALRRRLDSIV